MLIGFEQSSRLMLPSWRSVVDEEVWVEIRVAR